VQIQTFKLVENFEQTTKSLETDLAKSLAVIITVTEMNSQPPLHMI